MHRMALEVDIQASPEAVFNYFADHEKFAAIFGGSCTRVKDGDDEPNGLGSVRRIGPGPLSFDETIVVFDRPNAIHYAITRGGPLKNHLGRIHFLKTPGGGTRVDYVITFESKIPLLGGLVAKALKAAFLRGIPKVEQALKG
jgi:uncharacterized protein YndB with AHSA1/START domain